MSTSYPPHYAYPSALPLQRALPKPPRLHWGWVLGLSIVTLGLFASVWLLVQANWIRKMRQGKSSGFWLALANVLWLPLVFVFAFAVGLVATMAPSSGASGLVGAVDPIIRMGSFILYLCAVFVMRKELEADPIGIPLSGVMTFLFAAIYFQFHLRDYGAAYRAESGLGLSASRYVTEPPPLAYPKPEEVGVAYPPAPLPPAPPSA